ncbi:bifunctional 5,10-methylenetetrahydrofolate dehydrogenase/5,10-methenyltetrahydrofolate cyclohydrolase [Variovorax sp.]|uniref:bifunctional 5,10-methylenetetrahydrofolate dehydrogenase/5,10-methenyltetrahydrofolate cyclohydrolase n=1 Tax=Variovorax sp. TaxID=1871043 RepID=UPI002D329C93|nr:tetrahydrofolate dehydrogenase/cyclohydrolase catalytic domain-containing protein [Variovorax sp.]HYP82715.1 tetrahydrofolate dehydrogenase/cyclohydrolase catalytic domain-containing protein [Variovorax sp.]
MNGATRSECVVLDGKTLAARREVQLTNAIRGFANRHQGRVPTLATILVGDDPSSAVYVRMKGDACGRVGMHSRAIVLPASTSTQELRGVIDALNQDPDVSGILLQHPVPQHIDERACFDCIRIDKDVDGVTSHGFGRMALGQEAFGSATPSGIMRLLSEYGIEVAGRRAVVVGRSDILGKPLALMLSNADATVTLCHSRTQDLEQEVRRAQIVVAALGKPQFIPADWVADGAVVVDAGYHPGGIGDIEPGNLVERCSAVTPVPGGVGPMTISVLLEQTLRAAELTSASR